MSFPSWIVPGLAGASSTLPIVLCLHGGGTNASIFNVQTMRLQRALSKSFSFIFIDGPFTTTAGPGVMPFFEGCDPFYRWLRPSQTIENDIPIESRKIIEKTLVAIQERQGDVVGILGFSQGARIGAGLLWEQQLLDHDVAPDALKEAGLSEEFQFKFGCFLNGIAPPLTEYIEAGKDTMLEIPSIHVVGEEDEWRDYSRRLFTDFFDDERSSKIEFNIGHRLPSEAVETQTVATEMLAKYRRSIGLQ